MGEHLEHADSVGVTPLYYIKPSLGICDDGILKHNPWLDWLINQSDFPPVVTTSPKFHRKIIAPHI